MALESKKLYRSRSDRMLAGVAGGLGEYFGVDPIFFRIIFVILLFPTDFWGAVLIYLILAVLVPKKPGDTQKKNDTVHEFVEDVKGSFKSATQDVGKHKGWFSSRRNMLGLALVLIGALVLGNQAAPVFEIGGEFFWAGLIIVIGVYIILTSRR
jgi:phage shock protein C